VRGALICLAAAGCLAPRRGVEPVRVLPGQAVAAVAAVRFDVLLTNPNDAAAELQAVDWTLRADDRPIVRGRLDTAEPIAARSQRTLTLSVPAPTPWPTGQVRLEGLFHFRGDRAAPFAIEVGVAR
jgi:hypothetical protein